MCTSEVFCVFVVDVNIEIENVDCMKNFQSVLFVIVGLLSTVSCMRRQDPPPFSSSLDSIQDYRTGGRWLGPCLSIFLPGD